MINTFSLFKTSVLLSIIFLSQLLKGQEAEPLEAFPSLESYEPLWKRSMFTSRIVRVEPSEGPNFAEQYVLAGIYEVNEQPSILILDKTTQLVTETTMRIENELGLKVLQIEEGKGGKKTRVQLQNQKMETGWVTFGDDNAVSNPVPQQPVNGMNPAAVPTQ